MAVAWRGHRDNDDDREKKSEKSRPTGFRDGRAELRSGEIRMEKQCSAGAGAVMQPFGFSIFKVSRSEFEIVSLSPNVILFVLAPINISGAQIRRHSFDCAIKHRV